MSLSGIVSSVTSKVEAALGVDAPTAGSGTATCFGVGTTAAGAYMAQGGGGAPGAPGGTGSLVKKMLAGGVVGAGLGFGASFITPIVNLVPMAKVVLPAAGAALGAIAGLAMHFIGKRKQNLAMQAQAQAQQQGAMAPTPMPAGGVTLRAGARGAAAKKLQSDLATLGLYKGRMTGAFDAATSQAVRRYEVMKGVMPTGQGSPDVRAAVAQDASLVRQYA